MKISISGKNLEVSDYMREVAEKKLSKLSRYFPQDTEAQVTLSVERNRHIVEVTIPYEGRILRGEEVSGDMYASLDSVGSKLENRWSAIVPVRQRLSGTRLLWQKPPHPWRRKRRIRGLISSATRSLRSAP